MTSSTSKREQIIQFFFIIQPLCSHKIPVRPKSSRLKLHIKKLQWELWSSLSLLVNLETNLWLIQHLHILHIPRSWWTLLFCIQTFWLRKEWWRWSFQRWSRWQEQMFILNFNNANPCISSILCFAGS